MSLAPTAKRRKLPTSFRGLNRLRPLYPIRDEADCQSAQEVADKLAVMDVRTEGQEAYLETLTILMEAFEERHHIVDTSRLKPIDVLKYLLERNDMTASGLGRLLGNRQLGSKILSGQRQLSKAHIGKLCTHFRVSADLFIR